MVQTWLKATTSPRISRKLLSQFSFMSSALLFGLRIARADVVFIEAQPVFTSIAGVLLAFGKRCRTSSTCQTCRPIICSRPAPSRKAIPCTGSRGAWSTRPTAMRPASLP